MNPIPRSTRLPLLSLLRTIALVVLATAGTPRAVRAAEPVTRDIAALAWLTGSWTLERNGRTTLERWSAPAGGVMIGTSHTYTKDRTIEYEFIIIRPDATGALAYVAKPSGQREASFKLVRVSEREVLFENPDHDFPQRIAYTLQPDGMLLAEVSGTKDGTPRRLRFPYHPVK